MLAFPHLQQHGLVCVSTLCLNVIALCYCFHRFPFFSGFRRLLMVVSLLQVWRHS